MSDKQIERTILFSAWGVLGAFLAWFNLSEAAIYHNSFQHWFGIACAVYGAISFLLAFSVIIRRKPQP